MLFVGWVELAKPMRKALMGIASLNPSYVTASRSEFIRDEIGAVALSPLKSLLQVPGRTDGAPYGFSTWSSIRRLRSNQPSR
ncbi:hypothetical protein PCA10_16160 [Metapseudomonas resinovorans NBRC 106553]|uniref:Uncharacterized protein n=1 Tax=Metapseudomonas resinovorans NBRC 106553 TaxID=1245471 RepID=S6ANZ5_METRE|nr:hypothetical protein PCA10_16160 [Pseudomonas resinovorans NBRC 106553]